MTDQHKELIDDYNDIEFKYEKLKKKTLILEIFVVIIVCGMRSIQASASLSLNVMATLLVGLLLSWHFWDVKYRYQLDKSICCVVIGGVQIEKHHPFSGLTFFQNYLKKFNIGAHMASRAIFDFALLYFFSVSVTQLVREINPDIIAKLMPSVHLRTFIISAIFGCIYYMPLRQIVHLKRELHGS